MIERHDIDAGEGLSLHVEREGSGPPVVLLHGFTGSAATWHPLVERLRGRCDVIAVDLPGHGRSSAPDDPARYSLSRFVDDLSLVLDTLAIDRIALAGYSLGGRAALRFALHHPGRVSALVLESTSPGIVDPAERRVRSDADAELAAFIEREGIQAFTDRWERLPLWASQAMVPDARRAALRAQRLANSPAGLANSLRGAGAGATEPVADRLPELRAPVLLVAGALDERYVAAADAMQRTMPLARAAIVERAGHAVHFERPDAFADIVEAFLRQHVAPAKGC